MAGADSVLSGPWGPVVAIAAMALVTYLCRISGVLMMSRVRITPTVQRALTALPGSIVAATVAPIAIRSGPAAILGVVAAVVVARRFHNELLALLAGLVVAASVRALGL